MPGRSDPAGHEVVILDNLCNSRRAMVNGIGSIAGKTPTLVEGDIRDAEVLEQLFKQYRFDAVLHFAGLKSVGESVAKIVPMPGNRYPHRL